MKLRKGDTLVGRHLLVMIERLGGGGSGVTFLARVLRAAEGSSLRRGDKVVIKTPEVGSAITTDEIRKRLRDLFERGLVEADAEQYLKNLQCVAQVLEYGDYKKLHANNKESSDSVLAVVQEYVDGLPLNQHMDAKYGGRGGFRGIPSETEFFQWATNIVAAVRKVHQRQVVHGDIWQENVLVRKKTLEPVLIDFGQAAFISQGLGRTHPQRGTFLAPEGNTSVRSDIYHLGWLLLYLATGEDKNERGGEAARPPAILRRIGSVEQLKTAIVQRMRKRNPALYAQNCGIADIIARCLRKDPQRRTRNTAELLQDIVLFDGGASVIRGTGNLIHQIRRLEPASELIGALIGGAIMNLTDQLADLRLGVLDLHDDFVVGLTQAVSLLSTGDRYITVSTPAFWHDGNLGVQGRFLSANRQAVLRHGVTIRRLFLLTTKDLHDDEQLDSIIEAQLELARDLARQKEHGSKTTGTCELYFRVVTETERRRMVREGMNFGVLLKGDKRHRQRLLLSIGYDDDGQIGSIQFRSDRRLTQRFIANFEAQLKNRGTRPLSAFEDWKRQQRSSRRQGRRHTNSG